MDDIHEFCVDYDISKYTINPDGSVDVFENVYFKDSNMDDFPFKFNIVNGKFQASQNHLISIENAPEKVDGSFFINDNNLHNLKGCPKYINGTLDITDNDELTSLYVGDYDVQITGNIYLDALNFPSELANFIEYDGEEYYNMDKIRLIFKYQRHFEIWNKNESLNIEKFNELVEEINDGLL